MLDRATSWPGGLLTWVEACASVTVNVSGLALSCAWASPPGPAGCDPESVAHDVEQLHFSGGDLCSRRRGVDRLLDRTRRVFADAVGILGNSVVHILSIQIECVKVTVSLGNAQRPTRVTLSESRRCLSPVSAVRGGAHGKALPVSAQQYRVLAFIVDIRAFGSIAMSGASGRPGWTLLTRATGVRLGSA